MFLGQGRYMKIKHELCQMRQWFSAEENDFFPLFLRQVSENIGSYDSVEFQIR